MPKDFALLATDRPILPIPRIPNLVGSIIVNPKIIAVSTILSNRESRNIPALLVVLVILAKSPSTTSIICEIIININPKIIPKLPTDLRYREQVLMKEGCLTFPFLFLNISRPRIVEVEYEDIDGKVIIEDLD